MIAVVDYSGGNVGSLLAALERRGAEFALASTPEEIASARGVILPGDGAFGATMVALRARGLDAAVAGAIERGIPFLGICVGMQLLYDASEEHGHWRGFGILPGTVGRFADAPRVPHMGWNQLELTGEHPFANGLTPGEYVYFLHSYRAPVGAATVAACTHGDRFSAIVARGNVMGTQFHPEKSQATGAKLLDNYLAIVSGKVACC